MKYFFHWPFQKSKSNSKFKWWVKERGGIVQICLSSSVDSKEEEYTDCGSNLASTNGMGRLERFSINGDRKTDCWRCDWSWRQDNQPLRTVLSVVRSLAHPLRMSPGSCRHYLCFSSTETGCHGGSMQASQRPAMSAKWMMQDLVNESLNWGEEPQKESFILSDISQII